MANDPAKDSLLSNDHNDSEDHTDHEDHSSSKNQPISQSINQSIDDHPSANDEHELLIETPITVESLDDDDKKESINQSITQSPDQSFNLLSIMVAGAGFACDSYDLFIMNAVLVVMGCAISDSDDQSMNQSICKLHPSIESTLATSVLIGSMLGQLIFGTIADQIGRKKAFIATLSLLIVGAILSSASVSINLTDDESIDFITMLAISRFILGVGVGGEYPLSATVSSESSTQVLGRGKRVSAVFSMQSVGVLMAPIVVLLLLQMTRDYELVWRLALGIGALPGLIMLYWRFTMSESAVYLAAVDLRSSNQNVPDRRRLIQAQWKDLCGTAGNWWLFDIVFYANSFFSSKVTSSFLPIFTSTSDSDARHSYLIAVGYSLGILAIFGMPGYIAGTLLIDRWGRRKLQLFGYAGMACSYLLMSLIDTEWLRSNRFAFYMIYGASFFFCNCGPNVTTFVIPSEIFHTDIRSTCHGISACAGKFGAAIGASLYPFVYAASDESIKPAMLLSTGISCAGFIFTWVITRETKDLDLMSTRIQTSSGNGEADGGREVQLSVINTNIQS